MPCLTHWRIWLCHMEVGRTLVWSSCTYKQTNTDGVAFSFQATQICQTHVRANAGTNRMSADGLALLDKLPITLYIRTCKKPTRQSVNSTYTEAYIIGPAIEAANTRRIGHMLIKMSIIVFVPHHQCLIQAIKYPPFNLLWQN
jgi:hypothetical protein